MWRKFTHFREDSTVFGGWILNFRQALFKEFFNNLKKGIISGTIVIQQFEPKGIQTYAVLNPAK